MLKMAAHQHLVGKMTTNAELKRMARDPPDG